MDEFLKEGKSYTRLYNEYKKYGSLTIGFDFDGTVHDYHKTGESYEMVRQLLRDLKGINCKLICWTAYQYLDYVDAFLTLNKIPFVNGNGMPISESIALRVMCLPLFNGLDTSDLDRIVKTINQYIC